MSSRLFVIYAPSKLSGGGLILLKELLKSIKNHPEYEVFLHKDYSHLVDSTKVNTFFFSGGVFSRVILEFRASWKIKKNSTLLCFNNIPPLFRIKKINVALYLQNRFILDTSMDNFLEPRNLARYYLLRFFFMIKKQSITHIFVQTESMQLLVKKHLKMPSEIIQFTDNIQPVIHTKQPIKYDLIYVASGEKSKNHKNLLEALLILHKEQISLRLCLTVSPNDHPETFELINRYQLEFGLSIDNLYNLSREEIAGLYCQSQALIYPSLIESLGLPLLEATKLGLNIIASELDYVRDVCNPVETFDPLSSISIARSIKRFKNIESKLAPSVDLDTLASKFTEYV
jgi:glycosyltransferase involved in cell wall biosynthesis